MGNNFKEYTNRDLTVVWKKELCIHAAECVKGLPEVFNPDKRPWVDINAAGSNELMETIDKCPSGALTYLQLNKNQTEAADEQKVVKINTLLNGPLIISGEIELFDSTGKLHQTKMKTALCRCSSSKNQPFCDGSHTSIKFEE